MVRRFPGNPRTRLSAGCAALVALVSGVALWATPVGATASGLERPAALGQPPVPFGAQQLGSLPAAQRVSFEVVLAPRDPSGLDTLLANLYDPSSPGYHHWLAPGQFDREFGPAPSIVGATIDWLEGMGFSASAGTGFSVRASGSASQVQSAFGVSLGRYRVDGRTFFDANRTPEVPTSIASQITDVVGLNDLPAATPQGQMAPHGSLQRGSASVPAAQGASGSTPTCGAASALANQYGGYTTQTLGAAYGVSGLNNAGFGGQGAQLAVYELAPSSASDVSSFESCFGLHVPLKVQPVDGGGTPSSGGTGEADLDIEQLASQAPAAASITSYEGPNTDLGAYDVTAAIVNDDTASFVSVSWGECEAFNPTSGPDTIAAVDALLKQAAAQGQAVFTADGDTGSEDCYPNNQSTGLAVDYPSSSAWVTAVGGTSRSLSGTETVWNGCDGVDNNSGCALNDGAGGGGTSSVSPRPVWQANLAEPPGASCGSNGTNCREVPDISSDAGVPVAFFSGGSWGLFIGTSIAAPLEAAIWADRSTECATTSPGDAAPTLYALAASGAYTGGLNDITSGNNDFTGTNGGTYSAGVGYDMASGLGSVNAGGVACTSAQSVMPDQAPAGSTVTVNGFGLENATITFNGAPVQVLSRTATTAQVVVPNGIGTVAVGATGPVANAGSPASFTYGSPVGLFNRVYGQNAIGTAVAASQAAFPAPDSAKAVVLARDDFFSDALAGGPLAASVGGPVLITESAAESQSLDPAVQAEIQRVLPTGSTVYLLGGDLALSPNLDSTLQGLGYKTLRIAGADEYATAVAIAQQLNNPTTIFEATGENFPDALSAVPAAVLDHGAILLTEGPTQDPETATYLAEHPGDTRYAIGGPLAAAGADPAATPVYGTSLYDTSAAVASRFFPSPTTIGAATGANFPDALSAGPGLGLAKAPLLLVPPSGPLPASIASYLSGVAPGLTSGTLFGGPLAVADQVLAELDALA